jgi:two-component system, NtrC family, response regulator HydG
VETRRVLVVDDEPGMRVTLAANLELDGFSVVEAESGEQALALAGASTFDLVITDIRMPGINGVELFRKLREVAPTVPVVLMTGFALEDMVKGALEDGAYAVLNKPFDVGHALKVAHTAASLPVVLVVDDLPEVANSLSQALSAVGLRTHAVLDGESAEQALGAQNIDICVVDMLMNKETGPAVIQRMRAIAPDLVVIAMSGHDVPHLIREVASTGMHAFMKKPFRLQDLIRVIALARGEKRAA